MAQPSTPNTAAQEADSTQSPTTTPETSQSLATSLISRSHYLIAEIDAFQALLLQTQRNPQVVEARTLRSSVASELKTLVKLGRQLETAGAADGGCADGASDVERRVMHSLRSSNLPFYEAVWTVAKRSCSGLVAFGKRFYWERDGGRTVDGGEDGRKRPDLDKRRSVYVDIVADDGEEWVKVSTVSESRLLFEMAKKGWEGDSESGSDAEEGAGRTVLRNYEGDGDGDESEDDEDEIELVKLASDMRKAANATRVQYRHPRLRLVVPKLEKGRSSEIDDLLKLIRSYGVEIDCGPSVLGPCPGGQPGTTSEDLRHLLPTPFKRFTPTLNVDCTLLLAAVSDLSHFRDIHLSNNFHRAILRQLEVERERPLLPTELWPAMDGHEMVCTEEASKRMREIVNIIGTDTEKRRTEILMGDGPYGGCDHQSLIQKFQELSDFEIPPQWKLPIRPVDAGPAIDSAIAQGSLPPISHKITEILSDINYSVFMYGWVTGMVTISSNRTVVKQIEAIIEADRDNDEELKGPLVWVCETARSLVGKEKDRKS